MHSLRRQLTFGLLVAFALILGVGGNAIFWAMKDQLYDQFDRNLHDKAKLVMTQTIQRGDKLAVYFSDYVLRTFDDAIATEFFQVFNEQGQSVERSDSLGIENLPIRHGTADEPDYWDLEMPNGQPGRAIGLRFHPRADRRPEPHEPISAIIVVASGREQMIEALRDLRLILGTTVVGALVLTLLAVWWVLRRTLAPVQEVGLAASRIDAESLDQRLPVETLPTELQPMASKLNALLTRLQDSFARERHFSSDLAHELRTPVAELRSIAEVAIKWPDERTEETDRVILQIADQLEACVGTMLSLARAEQRSLELRSEALSLEAICRELIRPIRPRLDERSVTLETKGLETAGTLETDPVVFQSIMGNLLQNAADYAPSGSTIQLVCDGDSESFHIAVCNLAPELEPEDMGQIFNRFWRKDAARSGSFHAGLGLSLAQTFAELLGSKLKASFDADRRLCMRFEGPRRARFPNPKTGINARSGSE